MSTLFIIFKHPEVIPPAISPRFGSPTAIAASPLKIRGEPKKLPFLLHQITHNQVSSILNSFSIHPAAMASP